MNPPLIRPVNPWDPAANGARRRWPLLAIGASAGTAVWSGWVGLGELTGFGVVRPLPGIADSFAINTAVTLPIGVEAYAMYALSIATSNRPLPLRTRRYAWASSAAALLLGMAGQVAYHVMTAHQPADPGNQQSLQLAGSAPWWVIALVSCLPVLVLGAASLLWHLAGQTDHPDPDPDQLGSEQPDRAGSRSRSRSRSRQYDPGPESRPATSPAAHLEPSPGPESGSATSPKPPSPAAPDAGPAPAARPVLPRENDVDRVRAAIAAGDLPARPTVEAIREHLSIGRAYARAARTEITRTATTHTPTTTPEDSTAPPLADPATGQTPNLNGHAFTARSTRSEESTEPETDEPDHRTEALFPDHSTQPFNNTTSDLNPVST